MFLRELSTPKRLRGTSAPAIIFSLASLFIVTPAQAGEAPLGWVERVVMEPDAIPVKAKLDTGARTSSLHAEDIALFDRDDRKWVRFRFSVTDADDKQREVTLERPRVRRVRIKEHEGEYDRRPVVEMTFCLGAERYTEEFTLVDRSRFIYPVLLGRRFLSKVAPVSAGDTFTRKPSCPAAVETSE